MQDLGTWKTLGPGGPNSAWATVADEVSASLGEFATSYDVPGIIDEYRRAIDEALPGGVMLCGNCFYGPTGTSPDLVREAIRSIDFCEIVQKCSINPRKTITVESVFARTRREGDRGLYEVIYREDGRYTRRCALYKDQKEANMIAGYWAEKMGATFVIELSVLSDTQQYALVRSLKGMQHYADVLSVNARTRTALHAYGMTDGWDGVRLTRSGICAAMRLIEREAENENS